MIYFVRLPCVFTFLLFARQSFKVSPYVTDFSNLLLFVKIKLKFAKVSTIMFTRLINYYNDDSYIPTMVMSLSFILLPFSTC